MASCKALLLVSPQSHSSRPPHPTVLPHLCAGQPSLFSCFWLPRALPTTSPPGRPVRTPLATLNRPATADVNKCGFSLLWFFFLGAWGCVIKMEYLTVFRVVLGCAARICMIAAVSSSAGDHANPSGSTENDAKYREIFHFYDTLPRAKKEKPKYISPRAMNHCSFTCTRNVNIHVFHSSIFFIIIHIFHRSSVLFLLCYHLGLQDTINNCIYQKRVAPSVTSCARTFEHILKPKFDNFDDW